MTAWQLLPADTMRAWRAEIEVRTVLVGWRDVVAELRERNAPDGESDRLNAWVLEALEAIERKYAAPHADVEDRERLAALLNDARAEVRSGQPAEPADVEDAST